MHIYTCIYIYIYIYIHIRVRAGTNFPLAVHARVRALPDVPSMPSVPRAAPTKRIPCRETAPT